MRWQGGSGFAFPPRTPSTGPRALGNDSACEHRPVDRATFDQTVQDERLKRWLHHGPPTGRNASQLCLWQADSWMTVETDERAGRIEKTFRRFNDEATALDNALDGLRLMRDLSSYRG